MTEWMAHVHLSVAPKIREATIEIEREIATLKPDSREYARARLAWFHLVDAHNLLTTRPMTTDDYQMAQLTDNAADDH